MRSVSAAWPVIRRRIEDYPAVTTLLGLILLCLIPFIQYRTWVMESISLAQEAFQEGEHFYDRGDYPSAISEYARAYQLYQRPILDSKQVLDGKLELARSYHRLLGQLMMSAGNLNFDVAQKTVVIYSDLFTSRRSHWLYGLAGLKAISDLPLGSTISGFDLQTISRLLNDRYSLTSIRENPQRKDEAAEFYYLLGNAHELQFDFNRAFHDYDTAVQLNSADSRYQAAYNRLAELGNTSDMLQVCRIVFEGDPKNRKYYLCLIQEYRSRGRTEEVLEVYEDMLAVFGNDTFIRNDAAAQYYNWGLQQTSRGDFEEAIRAYQRAAELAPGSEAYEKAAQAQIMTLNVEISVRSSAGRPVEDAIALLGGEETGRSDVNGLIETNISYLSTSLLQVTILSEESGFYNTEISIVPSQTVYPVFAQLNLDLGSTLSIAKSYARSGKSQGAESIYSYLVRQASKGTDSGLNNSICWNGSLDGFAELVMPACDKAVAMMPTNGAYVDSRGLARALTGDFPGAIEDFKFFIPWARITGYADRVAQREEWIAALENGDDPFNSALLVELRNQ